MLLKSGKMRFVDQKYRLGRRTLLNAIQVSDETSISDQSPTTSFNTFRVALMNREEFLPEKVPRLGILEHSLVQIHDLH